MSLRIKNIPTLAGIKSRIISATPTAPLNLTSLLLTGDSLTNKNNNVFIDSSTNNYTITRAGDTVQTSFTPFVREPGNWSVEFNGSSYLDSTTHFDITNGVDFTIEAWVYPTASGTNTIVGQWAQASYDKWLFTTFSGYLNFMWAPYSTSTALLYGVILPLNQWSHVAVTKSGSTFRMFLNGSVASTATNTQTFTGLPASTQTRIGHYGNNSSGTSPTSYFDGYISNVRVVSGSALYTGTFTPSSNPLTAVAGTQLLTCQNNRYLDNSSANRTIVATGTPRVSTNTPFSTTVYNPTTMGGSAYFDGTLDSLSCSGTYGNFGTGDFTIEAWYMPLDSTNNCGIIDNRPASTNGSYVTISALTDGSVLFYTNTATRITAPVGSLKFGQWNHIAVSRVSGSTRMFVNGVQVGSTYVDTTSYVGTTSARINANAFTSANSQCYIADHRTIAGQGLYTTTFTPPAAPLSTPAGTQLHLKFTNAGIVDIAAKNTVYTLGNVTSSTTQSVSGGSSLYFDGSTAYLEIPQSPVNNITTGNFTIDFWMRPADTTTGHVIFDSYRPILDSKGLIITQPTADPTKIRLALGDSTNGYEVDIFSTTSISASTWYHVAVTRSGSTVSLFLNGVLQGTGTFSGTINPGVVSHKLGAAGNGTLKYSGYIDNFRIIAGQALYTANFTPSTNP